MRVGQAALYWRTLRYLRMEQIVGRLRFKLARPRLRHANVPPRREVVGDWVRPAAREPSQVGASEFSFLGVSGRLAEIGWDGPERDKLWRYNQHYFDDLNAFAAAARAEWHEPLMTDWVARNPPCRGTGWEPYPTSLRIVNWVKWSLANNALPRNCIDSLAQQMLWLSKRLEYHLLGNHLFANAKALIFAGAYFEGELAAAMLDGGQAIIRRELSEQVLPDGGNFERSTMYHALFLEDVLDLVNLSRALPDVMAEDLVGELRETAPRMIEWLLGMAHPDGEIALFNDAAFGIAPRPAELHAYARRLGLASAEKVERDASECPQLRHWPDSGYIRLTCGPAVAILDVAPIGPDYLPGHAHADTLSFEFSVHGQRVIVNGGTSQYGVSPQRLRERQTCSHSTVEVDGESSSEVWSGFRVARRAYPFDLELETGPETVRIGCSHDGYTRLRGKPLHRRSWALSSGALDIHDHVSGPHREAVARYILDPEVEARHHSDSHWKLKLPGGAGLDLQVSTGKASMDPARYAPRFGQSLETRCLAVRLVDGEARVRLSWS